MSEETLTNTIKKLKNIPNVMLTTKTRDGKLVCRPMRATFDDENVGYIYFLVDIESSNALEIDLSPEVNVAFQDSENSIYASVSGRAFLHLSQSKLDQYWSTTAEIWHPGGRTDGSMCVAEVRVHSIHLWENNTSKVAQLIELGSAILDNRKPEIGQKTEHSLHS